MGLEETRSALRRMAQVVSLHNRTAEQRTAKRLCMTNVTGLLLTSKLNITVFIIHDYCQACQTRFAVFSLLPSFGVS